MPSCAFTYLRTASGSSFVDGVAYSAIGTLPSVVMTSASTGAIERNAGDGEPGRDRRMRVHDRLRIGPLAVHLEVHLHLGRGIAIAGDLPARRDP